MVLSDLRVCFDFSLCVLHVHDCAFIVFSRTVALGVDEILREFGSMSWVLEPLG